MCWLVNRLALALKLVLPPFGATSTATHSYSTYNSASAQVRSPSFVITGSCAQLYPLLGAYCTPAHPLVNTPAALHGRRPLTAADHPGGIDTNAQRNRSGVKPGFVLGLIWSSFLPLYLDTPSQIVVRVVFPSLPIGYTSCRSRIGVARSR